MFLNKIIFFLKSTYVLKSALAEIVLKYVVGKYTHFFYKHMNFLAWAFAKHILCLFFSKKSLHVLLKKWVYLPTMYFKTIFTIADLRTYVLLRTELILKF